MNIQSQAIRASSLLYFFFFFFIFIFAFPLTMKAQVGQVLGRMIPACRRVINNPSIRDVAHETVNSAGTELAFRKMENTLDSEIEEATRLGNQERVFLLNQASEVLQVTEKAMGLHAVRSSPKMVRKNDKTSDYINNASNGGTVVAGTHSLFDSLTKFASGKSVDLSSVQMIFNQTIHNGDLHFSSHDLREFAEQMKELKELRLQQEFDSNPSDSSCEYDPSTLEGIVKGVPTDGVNCDASDEVEGDGCDVPSLSGVKSTQTFSKSLDPLFFHRLEKSMEENEKNWCLALDRDWVKELIDQACRGEKIADKTPRAYVAIALQVCARSENPLALFRKICMEQLKSLVSDAEAKTGGHSCPLIKKFKTPQEIYSTLGLE